MQIEGWCYRHNCPLHFIPMSGTWQYVCPECVKETHTYYATNVTVRTGKPPIRDMTVNESCRRYAWMADREKVIRGLKHCKSTWMCNGCPYEDDSTDDCSMYDDALALLKEQDTVEHALDVLRAHGWKDETEVTGDE